MEDKLYDNNKPGDDLPEELKRAGTRLESISAAKAELEAEAKAVREPEKAALKKDDYDEPQPFTMARSRRSRSADLGVHDGASRAHHRSTPCSKAFY